METPIMNKIILMAITAFLLLAGCGGEKSNNKKTTAAENKKENTVGLTDFQLENGIGPVVETVNIGEINKEQSQKGKQIFENKCSACHKLSERYVGPALGDILEKRTPAYVMNMILNPDQMVKEHPEVKKLLAEYLTPMPNQNIAREEARAIVEYLASVSEEEKTDQAEN
tara:strand:- start:4168 stop:4677 length:510 start_codon:yes stop_codon:yes gene_type:complete